MKIKNTNQTIFSDGDTSDIIRVVMMAYDIENDAQIHDLAFQLNWGLCDSISSTQPSQATVKLAIPAR